MNKARVQMDRRHKDMVDGLSAVSYTHLDVYKRQFESLFLAVQAAQAEQVLVPVGRVLFGLGKERLGAVREGAGQRVVPYLSLIHI